MAATIEPIYNIFQDVSYNVNTTISDPMRVLNIEYINESPINTQDILLKRIREFHMWLIEEQKDLEEESGADLSGLIDKLEETFPELYGEPEDECALSPPEILDAINVYNYSAGVDITYWRMP